MTLVIGNNIVEVGHGCLYICLFGRDAHIQTGSGHPCWYFARERSSMGSQTWAFGLTICASQRTAKTSHPTWADQI